MKRHRLLPARLVLICLGILALSASGASGAALRQSERPDTPALVRVDLHAPADLERLAAAGLPIYAHLYSRDGLEYLLLPVDASQQEMLAAQGFDLAVVDEDSRGASYYILHTSPTGSPLKIGESVRVLEQEGLTALVRADAQTAEGLAEASVEINRLQLHDLVIPRSPVTDLPTAIDPDPVIQEMVDQVLGSTVYQLNGGLSGEWPVSIGGEDYTILTRYSHTTTPIEKATQYGYEYYSSLGLSTVYDEYVLPGSGTRRNVVAEQPGLNQPERIFLITAHLDSTSGDAYNYAPGADDNASGSVGVMIAADILSQYVFDCTLRYVLFTGEEQGLYGSEAYALDAYNNGDNIQGVLNLDMIGYNTKDSPPVIELHTRPGNADDLAIANLFKEVVAAYGLNLTPEIIQDGESRSDHASFWQYGFPAILGIEDFQDFTPYYHTTDDQLETLDLIYFTNFVKAAVGTFAHMGCLIPNGYLAGSVEDSETHAPLAGATIRAQRATGPQYMTPSNILGDFQLSLTPGAYTVTVQADGYLPFSASDILITLNMTTTLDIALQPCHLQEPNFTYSPPDPLSGQSVSFAASVSADSTLPVTYSWDFGDGHSGSGQEVSHTYTLGGTYLVTMSAENCAGVQSATSPVTVESVPGINLSEQAFDLEAGYGQTLTRTLEIGNTGETSLTWSLQEQPEVPWLVASIASGELDPQQRVETMLNIQAPSAHGVYTTTLQVLSDDQNQPQVDIPVSLQIECSPVSEVDFTIFPAVPRIGQNATFTSQVSASQPVTYSWSFQDGSPDQNGDDLAVVEHAFPVNAFDHSYAVTLSAHNACSEPVQAEKNVLVSAYKAFLPVLAASAP